MGAESQFFAAAFSVAFVEGAPGSQGGSLRQVDLLSLPVASMTAGSRAVGAFVVKDVETSAYAAVYALESEGGGEAVRVEVATRGVNAVVMTAGTKVNASAVSAGTLLTAGSEAIAFIPNALGRAMLHRR